MLVSKQWLQKYFQDPLPDTHELVRLLTFHAFEVEGVESVGDDEVIDLDVLPNRAHDCLSHRGIAREIAAIVGIPLKQEQTYLTSEFNTPSVSVSVENAFHCRRYIAQKVTGISVGPSPEWLKQRLEAIGQRSVNNVVDAANFVMFDIGQPLHAFDDKKVAGGEIHIRHARADERITTLDGRDVLLSEDDLVIADAEKSLAIAGVKGGNAAEVTEGTTDIILESANFHPTLVRRTSRGHNLITDASKRFENEPSPELCEEAINQLAALIIELGGTDETKIEKVVDEYPRRAGTYVVGVNTAEVNQLLGTDLSDNEIEDVLTRLDLPFKKIPDVSEEVINRASTLIGIPYKYGASVIYDAPNFFDCSSLVAYCYAHAGVAVPRITVDQFVFGYEIEEGQLQPGDVVFSRTHTEEESDTFTRVSDGEKVQDKNVKHESREFLPNTPVEEGVDHCGIYIGDGRIIHAAGSSHKEQVLEETLSESPKFQNIVGYRRMYEGEGRFVISVPPERMDIRIKEDVIEEVGRIYGYENVPKAMPTHTAPATVDSHYSLAMMIRDILVRAGFSEVITSVFSDHRGEVEIQNPSDKGRPYFRASMRPGIESVLEKNAPNLPLLGGKDIRVFEIGNVYRDGKEQTELALGVWKPGKKLDQYADEVIDQALALIDEELSCDCADTAQKEGTVAVLTFSDLLSKDPDLSAFEGRVIENKESVTYQPISPYPFMLRDIAVWTPEGTTPAEVLSVIEKHGGDLLVRHDLFDTFHKEGRTSYAFNLVFQSHEQTLTDEQINTIMEAMTDELNGKEGFEVR